MVDDPSSPDVLLRSAAPSRLISLGFYDGTTNGLVELADGRAFRFDMVSWDNQQDERVYCLGRIPAGAFEAAVETLTPLGRPTWPQWLPRWTFASDQEKRAIEHSVDELVRQAEPYTMAILCKDLGTFRGTITVLRGRAFEMAQDFRKTGQLQPFTEWLNFFGRN